MTPKLRKMLGLGAAVLVGLPLLTACSTGPEKGQFVSDREGFSAYEDPASGYVWSYTLSEEGIVAPVVDEFREDSTGTGTGMHTMLFDAVKKGEVVLTMTCANPAEPERPSARRTYHLKVYGNKMIETLSMVDENFYYDEDSASPYATLVMDNYYAKGDWQMTQESGDGAIKEISLGRVDEIERELYGDDALEVYPPTGGRALYLEGEKPGEVVLLMENVEGGQVVAKERYTYRVYNDLTLRQLKWEYPAR